ncbi:MAG: deoxyribose-phosphate aldolase [Vicingaceae bacterium]|nr:deoxyribose-phosphate aldolase [Vicingaceae bacterium]
MSIDINNIPSLKADFQFTTTNHIDTILDKSFNINDENKKLKLILSLIDFTTLEGSDTPSKVEAMCDIVLELEKRNNIPNVAAICVYPTFAKIVRNKLTGTTVKTACVAGAFPSGQSSLEIKLQEIKWAIQEGATEIDMVISRGKLFEGKYQEVFDEIVAIKKCCGGVHLKVIIESGELQNNQNIRVASDLAMYAGADFIKTSTGKISEGATYNSVYVMLDAIKDYYNATGKKIGMKPAGGISNIPTAINYLKLVENTVGDEWLSPDLFRFGASSLAKIVLDKLS